MGRQLVRYVDAQLKFDSRLVRLVKQHKHLFDKDHKLFNDGKTRIDTWKLISEQLEETEIYCEKRWVYIINRFYDEIFFMVKYSSGSYWHLFPQLDFLKDYVEWEDIEEICNEALEFDIACDGVPILESEPLALG